MKVGGEKRNIVIKPRKTIVRACGATASFETKARLESRSINLNKKKDMKKFFSCEKCTSPQDMAPSWSCS